jgi:hypothetical protein
MKRYLLPIFAVFLLADTASQAQQPYAGMQARPIKALSEQQIADLKTGRGMGLALAAELNGYPGPIHLLELSDQIGLSGRQRADIQRLFGSMKDEAIPLGEKLLALESDLDAQFKNRTITAESLKDTTATIGEVQATLRNTHLKYHLSTVALLSPPQIKRYEELRGYSTGGHEEHQGPHH